MQKTKENEKGKRKSVAGGGNDGGRR